MENNTESDVNEDLAPDIMLLKGKRILSNWIASHTITLYRKDNTVMLTEYSGLMHILITSPCQLPYSVQPATLMCVVSEQKSQNNFCLYEQRVSEDKSTLNSIFTCVVLIAFINQ